MKAFVVAAVIFLVYNLLFALFWMFVYSGCWFALEKASELGNAYGMVNAYVSGLALFGVIFTVYQQREELKLQREELILNRTELSRSAAAQEESQKALVSAMHAQAFKAARDILQDEGVRNARKNMLIHLKYDGVERLQHNEIADLEIICHTYDTVGLMVKFNMLPAEYVVDSWRDSICRCWRIAAGLVQHYRSEREDPHLWESFELLAKLAYQKADKPFSANCGYGVVI